MRPNTPNKIQPRRLLLNPNGSPVPSVLNLSSTKPIAGLDTVNALAAATIDAYIPVFIPLSFFSGFPSIEHLTFPLFAIDGSPITGEAETPSDLLGARPARMIDEVGAVAVMEAIFVFCWR